MQNMDKTLREVGEHGFCEMVRKYAKTVHPTLTKEQAFTKVFTEDSDTGRAIRRSHQIAKQGVADEPDDDDEEEEEGNALDELNALAAAERKRNPNLSKAQAFTKAYADNPALAAKERRQNRPRA